jgi:hypothetical protein
MGATLSREELSSGECRMKRGSKVSFADDWEEPDNARLST